MHLKPFLCLCGQSYQSVFAYQCTKLHNEDHPYCTPPSRLYCCIEYHLSRTTRKTALHTCKLRMLKLFCETLQSILHLHFHVSTWRFLRVSIWCVWAAKAEIRLRRCSGWDLAGRIWWKTHFPLGMTDWIGLSCIIETCCRTELLL